LLFRLCCLRRFLVAAGRVCGERDSILSRQLKKNFTKLACCSIRLASFSACFAVFEEVFSRLRWHPRFAFGLPALPLCGAAPTFLCRGKEK